MFVYIDDVVIFSPSLEQHLIDLEAVFKVILDNGLKINLEKCQFFKESVEVLGYLLTTSGVKPTSDKIMAVRNWITLKNVTPLRSFLGTVGVLRKELLFYMVCLKKGQDYDWQMIHQVSFEELKDYLIRDPILKISGFFRTIYNQDRRFLRGFWRSSDSKTRQQRIPSALCKPYPEERRKELPHHKNWKEPLPISV